MILMAATLGQSYRDAWQRAEQSSQNLLLGVTAHIDRYMRLYSLELNLASDALRDMEWSRLSAGAKHRMLASIAGSADYVGSMLLLDAKGDILVDSESEVPRAGNFSDRDFFRVPRDGNSEDIYVSEPYRSRMANGAPSIALSRRIENPDGSFAGVVTIAIRLAYIDAFFKTIDMGRQGELLLLSMEGRILARQPEGSGNSAVGTSIATSPIFLRVRSQAVGSFVARDATDGVDRYYSFARVPNQPFIVNVAFATKDLFEDWWLRAGTIGAITFLVCIAMVVLAVMLRRELHRRAIAEADLAFLSLTDGLTGLANRRRFDDVIRREWRRTGRTGASLALLMIDVDRFKMLNDAHGHVRGDEVLKRLARVIDECIRRPGDVAARYGGEEFAVVLPDTDNNAAMGIAEMIRAKSEATNPTMPSFTVSIGVKAIRPSQSLSLEDFIEAADRALYRAKSEGRNRVVMAS